MSVRASTWSITINNPLPHDEENINQARQRGWKVYGQIERGTQGTLHYQIMLKTPQVRFSLVKKVFPRAHIEVCRNPEALAAYVQKEDTRVTSLAVSQEKYPTQQKVFEWFSLYYYDVKKSYPHATNLEIFDLCVGQKIRQGYYIGVECVNPQVRAYIKKFGEHLAFREKNKLASTDRQTDRHPNLFSQHVVITENADQEENATLQEETSDPPSSGDEDERS